MMMIGNSARPVPRQRHNAKIFVAAVLVSILAHGAIALCATAPQTPDPHSVPSVDGAVGPCSADFTITDTDNKPVYNAKVKVHIAYGFLRIRKLDLEVSTNADGKARFTGIPNRMKFPLLFQASEGDREAEVTDDPSATCQAKLTMTLQKKPPQPPSQ